MKKASFGATKAALGCGVIMIFVTGIFGFVLSFLTNDPELAAAVRSRCLIGILIGIAMVIAWKIFKSRLE
jgi:xanthine/uracil/vitamin C permease (AzgA family)